MHSCWTSGDAPQDIAWGFDMSVENEARPQGPSKVSRRNLIAGAAVAVPAAAVLNASSAWAKPVVNSLIGMPALVASVQYKFTDLFVVTNSGSIKIQTKKITISSFTVRNKSGENLSVGVSATVSKTGYSVSVSPNAFGLANNSTQAMTLEVASPTSPPADIVSGTYSITLTFSVTDAAGHKKAVNYYPEVVVP